MKKIRSSILLNSFKHAIEGIINGIKYERNIKIHFICGLIVFFVGSILQIDKYQWMYIALAIGFVLVAEYFNTAIEHLTDLVVNNEFHPLAKEAKDASAGAVLLAAITALIIGLIVFVPKINCFLLTFDRLKGK